jgi:thioredoxin reductase
MSSLVDYPVSLPTEKIPPETDAVAVATAFAPKFASLASEHFDKDAIWRDCFALTGTLRTFYSASTIQAAWSETSKLVQPGSFSVNPKSCLVLNTGHASWLQAIFPFETAGTPQTICSAIVALVPGSNGGWRIWSLRTIIEQLKGQSNVDILEPVNSITGFVNGIVNGVTDGASKLMNGLAAPTHFECVVVGGGQAGLSLGGRLQALGVNYVILDKHNEVGDSWKTRYNSARLHTTREYAHLPFDRTFPAHYQEWLTKDDLAQGYRDWTSKFGINIWQRSKLTSGDWDSSQKLWTLTVLQDGEERVITCAQVVLAGGGGGQIPTMPEYPGRDAFEGIILHSGTYIDAKEWKGKHGVVIGTANTGHDIAEDMLAAALSKVTMVQRSKTFILPVEYYKKFADATYNASFPTELADKMGLTQPYVVQDLMSQGGMHSQARQEPERFDALEKAGFKTERYGSITHHLYNRLGGHYMDVGASAKIAKGLVNFDP